MRCCRNGLAELDRLAGAALADPDPWRGFAGFMDGLFVIQARDRSMNEAIARNPVGSVDVGRRMWARRGSAGLGGDAAPGKPVCCGPDFGADDLATIVWAMSKVIAMSNGDDAVWRRHLGFVLDGLRAEGRRADLEDRAHGLFKPDDVFGSQLGRQVGVTVDDRPQQRRRVR